MARVDAAFTNGHAPLVLVVEDEFFLRYVTAEYLEDCGFSVLQAANADEAVGLLQTNSDVGAVFSDIQMPGSMNGLGLAHWITETLPDVKVLLTSGQVLPAAAQEWTPACQALRHGGSRAPVARHDGTELISQSSYCPRKRGLRRSRQASCASALSSLISSTMKR